MIGRQPYLPRWMAGGESNPLGARRSAAADTIFVCKIDTDDDSFPPDTDRAERRLRMMNVNQKRCL
jgi:hypothetical protein